MAKIVVFGGSGMIGRCAVREALGRGHEVTVVVRDPSKVTDEHPNLTVTTGDVTDPGSVAKAAAGAEAVISAVSAPQIPGGSAETGLVAAANSLIEGLRSLAPDSPRLLIVGGAGSLLVAPGVRLVDVPEFPDAYKATALGHAAALDVYRGVEDVEWSYLSPAAVIAPGERTGTFRLGGDELVADAEGNSQISAEDYAIALIDEAEEPKHLGRRFTLAY